jgi:hypothetical protein
MLLPLSQATLLMSSLLGSSPAAVQPLTPHLLFAQTDPIKGSDTMGDKGRSGPDGWIQAPVARDAAASGSDKAPGETKQGQTSTASKSAGNKPMNPGDDPGTVTDPTKGANPGNAPK